jgi:hypothetical protein
MFGRLREIDDELRELPAQLAPLESKVQNAREFIAQSEHNNPLHAPLSSLLAKADRNHIDNLGWLVGKQVFEPAEVARHVDAFLIKMLGKSTASPEDQGQAYEKSLPQFVRVDGGSGMPTGFLEGALLRKLFGDPWLALDSRLRTQVMEQLRKDVDENSRWLPDVREQVLDVEGRSIVGEGAGAFGAYFGAAAVIAIGMRQYRLPLPTRAFANLPGCLELLSEDTIFKRLNSRLVDAAGNAERARGIVTIAYVHLIRAIQWGHHERDHRKLQDALTSVEVALANGKKRIERLREDRGEILLQAAGVIGIAVMVLAALAYVLKALADPGDAGGG